MSLSVLSFLSYIFLTNSTLFIFYWAQNLRQGSMELENCILGHHLKDVQSVYPTYDTSC